MFVHSNFVKKLALALAALPLASALPSHAEIAGQWDFTSGNLAATTGQDLEYYDGVGGATEQATAFGTTTSLGLPDIGGKPAHVMSFPKSLPTMGYVMHSNMQPNGGGSFVNQYTLIFDLLYTGDAANSWRALTQIDDPNNANDSDFFINPSGGIGISGAYQGTVKSNTWQRIALAVDLAGATPTVRKFINGAFVGQQTLGSGVDGRWAISSPAGGFGDSVLLFTDDSAEGTATAPGYVSSIQVRDEVLSDAYIAALGAPQGDQIPATVQVPVAITSRQPATNAVNVMPGSKLSLTVAPGSEPFDPASISLKLNGQPFTASVTPQDGKFLIEGMLPSNLAARSQNSLELQFIDAAQGGIVTQQWNFSVAPYTLDPALSASLPRGLTAYWKLDEGSTNINETTLHDLARGNDSSLATSDPSAAWLTGAEAKFGSALFLDGLDSYVMVSTNDAMNIKTNQVTVSAWVKLSALPSELSEAYGSIYDAVEDDYVLYLDKGNRELRFKVTDANGQAARPGIPENLLPTGEWINVVGVYDGQASTAAGEARIYLNGQLVKVNVGNDGSGGTGLTGNVRAGQIAAMGRNGTQENSFLNGAVDDVAVWSRALTADEIGYIASGHTLPVTGALTVPAVLSSRIPAAGAVNLLPGSTVGFVLTQGSETIDPASIKLSVNGQPLTPAITTQAGAINVAATLGNLPSRSQNNISIEWNDPAVGGTVADQWTFTMAPYGDEPQIAAALQDSLVANWKLDEGLTNTLASVLEDSAGTNDLALTALSPDTAWLTDGAKFGSALFLDENTYADVPQTEALNITNRQVSISAWVNLSTLPSRLSEAFGSIYDAVEDDYVLYLDRGNKELRFKVTDANGQAARPGIPEARLATNQWLHVAAVYDGTARPAAGEARIYLNGQLMKTNVGNDGSGGAGLTNTVRAGQSAALGKNGVQINSFLHGAVDDVAIWKRALTTDEIGYLAAGHAVQSAAGPLVEVTGLAINGQNVQITWSGPVGTTYQLQRRSSLSTGTWQNVGSPTTATSAQDTVAGASMFYRVQAQ